MATGSQIYKALADSPGFQTQFPMLYTYGTPVKRMTRQLIGREKQLRQLKAGLLRPELCNVLLLGDAGSGKALSNDTLIPVADDRGYVPISDLKVGDTVFNELGLPTRILGVYPQGKKRAYSVHFSDDSEIICNDEHLWTVKKYNCKDYETMTLRQMIDYDYDLFYVPMNGAVRRTERKFITMPYVVGAWLSNSKTIDIEKSRIPEAYMLGSIEQRYELLRGLMDTSGVVSDDGECNCFFKTYGKDLASDVRELVCSLGMRASIFKRTDGTIYNVHIFATDEEKTKLFSISKNLIKIKNYLSEKTISNNQDELMIDFIEELDYDTEMTCIYVDSPSHLFQAGKDHIVTHNTALVQGAMAADTSRVYLEIDISKMIADLRDNNEMAVKIKALFDESAKFVKESGTEIVLFIDEFHLICMLSDAAVEALKPQLADSGTRGVRTIVATTFTEFREYISANQPLVQRLQRIEILPPSKEAIVSILKSFAKIYGVADEIHGTYLYEQIIELSNRYIPANSQPRKSILLLDLMVGWYRAEPGTKMDIDLLYNVLKYSEGIELNVSVDAVGIKKRLDSKVFSQYLATSAVASRLQITSADLNNKTKPMGSFLFTGSTGKSFTEKPCVSGDGCIS